MIGTNFGISNKIDIYLFPKEIIELKDKIMEGDYINLKKGIVGKLILGLREKNYKMSDLGEYKFNKSENGIIKGLEVYINERKYSKIVDSGIGLHLGYAHINIYNLEKINPQDELVYNELLSIKERLKNKVF